MEGYKYMIIGGGLAGQRAGDGIRKMDTEGTIALVAGESHLPYQRPPLSKGYLTGKEGLDHVYLKDDSYYAQGNIKVISGIRATKVDSAACSVTLDDGRVLGYEKLLLATGGHARRLSIPGNDLPGVFTLRTIEDSDGIREAAESDKRALVIGGSFIGSEVASSLAQLGLNVVLVFPEMRLLERVVPEELSAFLHAKYEANGVRILARAKPGRLEGNGKVERVRLENGEMLNADLVVMGVGIQLNTELARDAGLALGEKDAVVVNEYLRTSDPNIYAAGDIAAWPDPTFGKRLRVEHWDVARSQGLRAGRNMAGEEKPYTALPYFFSDLFDLSFEVWGDLTSWDQTVLRGTLEGGSFALYYFDRGKMVAVLATGRPDEERKPMQALVKVRPAYGEVAARLSDEGIALDILVRRDAK
jgi:3-phenylpropionate/trans-cinnamate dioxygenase ferredoxin reductase subunit